MMDAANLGVMHSRIEEDETTLRTLFVFASCLISYIQYALFRQMFPCCTSLHNTYLDIPKECGKQVMKFFMKSKLFKRLRALRIYMYSDDIDVVGEGGTPSPENPMQHEWSRYSSFQTYPMDCVMMPTRLTQAGFYYTGFARKVKCFCCGITNETWRKDETAIEVHKRLSRNCPFIRCKLTGNIPIHTEDKIQHPEFVDRKCRRTSFDKYPSRRSHDRDILASAGFFYTGVGATVKCYFCGKTIDRWRRKDDPWTTHAKHSPKCKYLLMQKGEEFVSHFDSPTLLAYPDLPFACSGSGVNTFITNEKKALNAVSDAKDSKMKAHKDLDDSTMEFQQRSRCKVCLDNEANILISPCNHLAACQICAAALTTCCICRKTITGLVTVYKS